MSLEDAAGEHQERGDEEGGVDLVDPVLVLEQGVGGAGALGEGVGGAGLLVVEELGEVEAGEGDEDGDGGEAEFQAVAGGGGGCLRRVPVAKTGSRKCSK